MSSTQVCTHASAQEASPSGNKCEECDSTVNLRMCTECGHVGCCESQAGHNTEHYRKSGHAIIRQMPVEHGWLWCYECSRYL